MLTQSYLTLFGIRRERKDMHNNVQLNMARTVAGEVSLKMRELQIKVLVTELDHVYACKTQLF